MTTMRDRHEGAHATGPELYRDPAVYARRWYTLGVLCLSLLIVFVGNSSLNVAIPTLSRVLDATESQLQWVIAIYSLVFAGFLFSTGAIGDRFGRKGALQFGLVVFLCGCLAASLSTDMNQLIACRAVMGLGAAFIMPSTLSILVNLFPPAERTRAIAIWAAITGAAGAIGPVATGFLLKHFWYGSVFLINVPIIAVALILGKFLVPKSRDPQEGRLDPVGSVLSIIGVSALVYGLIEAPDKGWASTATLAAFGIGVFVLAVFTFWELRNPEPMLDIRYFRNLAFRIGTSGMVLVFMAMYGVMFLITQYFQLVLGYSALSASIRFLPIAVIMLTVAPRTPRLSERFGSNRVVGFGMACVSTGFFMFLALGTSTPYLYVFACLVVLVTGMALSISPMTSAIMSAVPERRAGAGSAMNDATREFGAALGVAVLGSIAASVYRSSLGSAVSALSPANRKVARSSIAGAIQSSGTLPRHAGQVLHQAAASAFVDGVHLAVGIGGTLALIAATLVVRNLPKEVRHEGAMHNALSSFEDAATLGIAGVPPVFVDEY